MNIPKISSSFIMLFVLSVIIAGVAVAGQPGRAVINIDVREEKAPVPAGLYGIFLEEISHAFDGGIYAELIQNRSFEEGVLPPGMKLVEKEDGSLKMELESLPAGVPKEKWDMPWPWRMNCGWDPKRELIGWSLENRKGAISDMKTTAANPMNEASSRSLELRISQDDKVRLINSGYWGINLEPETDYDLVFYLRAGTFQGTVAASLESRSGKVFAQHDFGTVKPGNRWKKYTATLTSSGSDPKGRFVLTFTGTGTIQVDWVSLFPPTYKGKPNGLRIDLATYLEELKPDFVRYPGGCYVQGLSWESAPDWRKMVCDPVDRPGMWGYWKYRSTDGFGYHEFLEFCEDVGADAMYVSFCGMTVHPENNWPLDEIKPVIQRTLDAIEYAIGPEDSKWGKVRAEMGHPEPFPLKYVEIGNEHPPAVYGDYYVLFREAIKEKYPDMTVIMSMYWSGLNRPAIERAGDENIDIVDEHAYRNAYWIRTNFDYFDKYERMPWKVYVGEYASHSQNGDWKAAMGDSVYLMMMERNGDMVTMASYAPLFCNVNEKSWGVNLIEFDSSRSFAHASYYVQKTFNENRPDVNLEMTAEAYPRPDPDEALLAGRFGLGAWRTSTEFKELRMYDEEGHLIYSDDFKDMSGWETPGVGTWTVENGVLKQTDTNKGPAKLLLKTPLLKTGKVTLKARRVAGDEGFLMLFNAEDYNRFLFCNYGASGNEFTAIQSRGEPEGCSFKTGQTTRGSIEDNRWYDIALVVKNNQAEIFLDGRKVSDASVENMPWFFSAAGYDDDTESVIVKATNYYSQPVEALISLNGAAEVSKTGRHIVLSSDHPLDQNTLENPRKIVPREKPLLNCAKDFTVLLEPFSVNLLRIKVKR